MFGFITNTIRTIVGVAVGTWQTAISAVTSYFGSLIRTHYMYWHTVSGHVASGWQQMAGAMLHLMERMQAFMFAQGLLDAQIRKHDLPFLSRWISWLGGKIQHDLGTLRGILHREIVAGDAKQHAYTRSVLLWVLLHVLAFLLGLVRSAFSWINGIGATMWHFFTHLAEFAELLFMFLVVSLEKHAWQVGKLLGTFFLSLVVHNMVRFAKLVEDIVDAVL
jgi:hypothetical protein